MASYKGYQLQDYTLYVAMTFTAHKTLHWGLYLNDTWNGNRFSGTKHHLITAGNSGFLLDSSSTTGLLDSLGFVCLARVGQFTQNSRHYVNRIINETSPSFSPGDPGVAMDCQVWVLKALMQLKQAGYVSYNGIGTVKVELDAIGSMYAADMANLFRNFPVRLCNATSIASNYTA